MTSPLGHTYEVTYDGMSSYRATGGQVQENLAWQAQALLSVRKEGELLGRLTTEKRQYVAPQQQTTEVGIQSSLLEDFYVILSDVEDLQGAVVENDPEAQTASFTFLVNPLVPWIWAGGFILTLGSLIALWPAAERVRKSSERPTAPSPRPSRREPAVAAD